MKIQRTRCLVKNTKDPKCWNLPFYCINLDEADTDIHAAKNALGIPKTSLKLGDKVGFKDNQRNGLFGEVIRLNPKRATVKINGHDTWLVYYRNLFRVIEGGAGNLQEQTFIPYQP